MKPTDIPGRYIEIRQVDENSPFIVTSSDHPEKYQTIFLLAALNKALEWMHHWPKHKEVTPC
jgi:hypothetical protein